MSTPTTTREEPLDTRPFREARKQKRRRRLTMTTIALFALGSMAFAAWLSLRETASQTFTAQGIGQVDIGDLETLGIFPDDLDGIAPGFTTETQCTVIRIDNSGSDEPATARLYFPEVTGELANHLRIEARQVNGLVTPSGEPGRRPIGDCSGTFSTLENGVMAQSTTDHSSYETGIVLDEVPADEVRDLKVRWTATLPADAGGETGEGVAGETATFSASFENRGG